MIFMVIAQVSDSLSGGGGWLGAGLLGAVLAWLLGRHLPEKDRLMKELIESKDSLASKLTERFETAILEERRACDAKIAVIQEKMDGMFEFFRDRAEASAKRKGVTS